MKKNLHLISRKLKKVVQFAVVFCLLIIFCPYILMCYLCCGILDLRRNKLANVETIKRYFIGNGIFTWLLSPFNLLLDCFSYKNKGVYCLEDLPKAYQSEIQSLLSDVDAHKEYIKCEMAARLSDAERGMLFFKWYGENLKTSFSIPSFHKNYQYIKTIGLSVFNRQTATSTHFGPLRITFRVLYNISPVSHGDVYIMVRDKKYYWHEAPLFIFDDTLQHQSVNYSDDLRYCMFIDIIRPTPFTRLFSILLKLTKFMTAKGNAIFYKKWVFVK